MSSNYIMTLKGADPANRPVVTSNDGGAGFGIVIECGTSKTKTVKDLIFSHYSAANGLFLIDGIGVDCFHLNNIEFLDAVNQSKAGWIGGLGNGVTGIGPFGLVEHCQFITTNGGNSGFFVHQNQFTPDADWGFPGASNAGFSFGTNKAVYFEDNTVSATTFTGADFVDGGSSAKVVIRHNHITNMDVGFHGPDSSGPRQSTMQVELMHNDYHLTPGQAPSIAAFIRGGTAYFFDNSIPSGYTNAFGLELHCSGPQYAAEGCRDCATGAPLTAPLAYPANYPACQQPGHPAIPPVRVWSNTFTHDEVVHYLLGYDGKFMQGVAHDGYGPNFYKSDDASAAPSGYTEFTYPFNDGVISNAGGTPQPPVNLNPPAVTGVAAQGQVLSAYPGFWTWDPVGTFAYQWQACDENGNSCSNIVGAASSTYTQTSSDIGYTHRVIVSSTNSAGGPISVTSPQNDVTVAPGTENRITNPGFETHTGAVNSLGNDASWTGWVVTNYGNGWIQSSTSAHSGAYAFEIQKNTGSTVMAIEQPFVPAGPGDTMQVSFWTKNSLSGYGVVYYVKDLTHNTNIIGPTRAPDSIGSYTKVQTSFVVPAGCVSAKIGFDSSSLGAGGGTYMWLDDVVVAPPAVPIDRPSPPQNVKVSGNQ